MAPGAEAAVEARRHRRPPCARTLCEDNPLQQAKPGAKNPSNKQSPKHASNAKPDALAKDPKKSGVDADKTAKKPPAVGGAGKLNETSEGEDEKYTTEQNEENKDDNYTSQNYTEEYSSAQNKSGNDFNKLNKKFEL